MKDQKLRRLVLCAMFAALTCVATMVIQVPSPATNGYINLGDCFVLLGAWVLGPAYGFAAGGVGSALADLFSGYTHYVPGTFVIKGCMALAAWFIFHALHESRSGRILGSLAAETVMVLGYFGYAALLLQKGLAAASSIPGNIAQAIGGIVVALLLYEISQRLGLTEKFYRKEC